MLVAATLSLATWASTPQRAQIRMLAQEPKSIEEEHLQAQIDANIKATADNAGKMAVLEERINRRDEDHDILLRLDTDMWWILRVGGFASLLVLAVFGEMLHRIFRGRDAHAKGVYTAPITE